MFARHVPEMERKANDHRRHARQYLEHAKDTTDPDTRKVLIDLCENELVAAVAAREFAGATGKRKLSR